MKTSKPCILICISIAFFCSCQLWAQRPDTLVLPEKIAFSKDSRVFYKVRTQCSLEETTWKFIAKYSRKYYKKVVTQKPQEGDYHTLNAEIIQAYGLGGGGWSGAKSLKVKGWLKDANGKLIGSFEAGRFSGGGAFAPLRGTCSVMNRCSKAIGKDIAWWLNDPRMDSYLGDH